MNLHIQPITPTIGAHVFVTAEAAVANGNPARILAALNRYSPR